MSHKPYVKTTVWAVVPTTGASGLRQVLQDLEDKRYEIFTVLSSGTGYTVVAYKTTVQAPHE